VWNSDKRTKKGISLTLPQWSDFLAISEKLDADLERVKTGQDIQTSYPLSDKVFVTIQSPYRVIHIRRWYQEKSVWKPGRQGITLREPEWHHLLDLKDHLIRTLKHRQDE